MSFNVIAIEREFATGGLEVGKKLAKKLNIPCYSKEILEIAAEKMNLSVGELKDIEESTTGNLLFSLNLFASYTSGGNIGLTKEQKLALVEAEVVKELSLNPCVIVGRGAAGLLDEKNVLKVFILADIDVRRERAINIYNVEELLVDYTLRKFDKRRANYFNAITGVEWRNPKNYHMILNSSKLDIDSIADILFKCVEKSHM